MLNVYLQCAKGYVDDDVIVINGTDEEIADLQARLERRRFAAKVNSALLSLTDI